MASLTPRRACRLLALIPLFASTWFSQPAAADAVTDWNATAQSVIVAKGAQGGVYYALVHIAIYDAVNAIDGRYSVFAVRPTVPTAGASKDAAAATAAYRTLLGVWPDQKPALDAAYASSLVAIPEGVAKTKGIAIGEEVATSWLAMRADDGREANVPYTFGTGPGVYQRTLPGPPSPVTPWMAKMRPFALRSASQFRAYGPPDVTSRRYAEDLKLTQALGSANSTERTPEETEIGLFYTENPTTFWGHNMRDFAAKRNLDIAANARLFALLSIAQADAAIACWDSKYYFNFWRPVTAIAAADTDDNPYTDAEPTWAPLAATPPHPEYPAAHACVSSAYAGLLAHFFGTNWVKFTLTSSVAGTVPHTFYRASDLPEEVKMARVYGGMHFHTSTEHGAIMGRRVAEWVARHYFKPVRMNR
jgi:hypothetical protein